MKLPRKKKRIWWLSVIYRLQKLLPLSRAAKFRLFLNLEWIFDRLAHEQSFHIYTPAEHPVRLGSKDFLLSNIRETDTVLDLGCNLGDISFIIAQKARKVVAIDYSRRAIEIAKKRYQKENLEFVVEEANEFLSNSGVRFDVLVLSHILEHLDEPGAFLSRISGHFSRIYIELPDFDRNYLNRYRVDQGMTLVYSDNDHVSEFDREELKAVIASCRLRIDAEEYRYGLMKLWCSNAP